MKNFPHQFSQLPRLADGLAVVDQLLAAGGDVRDDCVLGDAMALAGVYTFRGPSRSVRAQLADEHLKRPSDQGHRTGARELRRTFDGLGFLTTSGLSVDARRLLALSHDPLHPEARAVWRRALRDLVVTDDDGSSHPYRIMLRLAGDRPGIEKALLGLCFEAADDSEAEYRRVLDLVDRDQQQPAWDRIGASKAKKDNSVKILPSLAQQLGDITVEHGVAYLGLPDPDEIREEPNRRAAQAAQARQRKFDPQRTRGMRPRMGVTNVRTYNPDLLAGRYEDHERCLREFAALFDPKYDFSEGDYDLVVAKPRSVLLAEVKTIRLDGNHQVRLGVGQLLYYEVFDVEPVWPGHAVDRVLVTDGEIDAELIDFVERQAIGVVMRTSSGWAATERAKQHLAKFGVTV